jgi:hypothetical protein
MYTFTDLCLSLSMLGSTSNLKMMFRPGVNTFLYKLVKTELCSPSKLQSIPFLRFLFCFCTELLFTRLTIRLILKYDEDEDEDEGPERGSQPFSHNETVLIVWVLSKIMHEIGQVLHFGARRHFKDVWNKIDALQCFVFGSWFVCRWTGSSAADEVLSVNGIFVSFRLLYYFSLHK